MNVVRVKPGVSFDTIAPGGFRILEALNTVARRCARDLEITCGTEDHPADDPHTHGEAYDVSVAALDVPSIVMVRAELIVQLGPAFTVLYESPTKPTDPRLQLIVWLNAGATAPHIHVQVKKGTVYPAIAASPAAATV
jgi:hypothetical protein